MPTNLTIHANTDDAIQDQPLGTSGVEWTEIDGGNDFIIITRGTTGVVDDGQPIPGATELNSAGLILEGAEIIVDKYFLADASANDLKQIHLMGDQNSRYVLAFDFDGPTASEPVLEFWDDITLSTIANISLGDGIASNSWFRGKTTTTGTAGSPGWSGNRLAGAGSGNFLFLNNQSGALVAAGTLYCTLKVIAPASATIGGAETPVGVVKFTTN
jgi:hypothetical protein